MITCDYPQEERQVFLTDTLFAFHSNSINVVNFDKNNRIISLVTITDTKSTEIFDFTNLETARYSTKHYDTAEHVIYESILEKGVRFHCYSYKYNDKGQLIAKEGYSSGEEGVKMLYEYDSTGKLVREIIKRAGGTTIRSY
jgi:hypothetical protein